MFKFMKRFWAYLTAASNEKFNEHADPKIQLAQAMAEAYDQHAKLKTHASNVIAQAKMTETSLDRQLGALEKLNAQVRAALKMSAEAEARGDHAKAQQYNAAAETLGTQLITIEATIADLKETHYSMVQAADEAKAAVATNQVLLDQKKAESRKLLSTLEQARLTEQMNKSMASLGETVGEAVPTLDEVREKIETRYARAKGMQELGTDKVDAAVSEVTAAVANVGVNDRLEAIRAELGIESKVMDTTGAEKMDLGLPESTSTPLEDALKNLQQVPQQATATR